MLPQQRNEATIENAIERVRKVLNAAENSNQAGEDLIVVMANGPDLYEALKPFAKAADGFDPPEDDDGETLRSVWGEIKELCLGDLRNARAALSKAEGV